MKLHSINADQKVYVVQCGRGFSCYGFAVLDKKARGVRAWLAENGQAVPALQKRQGTARHFAQCARIIDLGAKYSGESGKRCPADLVPQLIGLEGRRVEVTDVYGETRRFTAGTSCGWLPCHVEIATKRSSGGGSVTGAPFSRVTVIE